MVDGPPRSYGDRTGPSGWVRPSRPRDGPPPWAGGPGADLGGGMTQPASGPPPVAPLPGWLGPIVTVTTQVGVPTVIAGVLLWFVLFRLDTTLKVIERSEDDRVRVIAAIQDTMV